MNADDGNSVQGLGEGRQLGFIALHEINRGQIQLDEQLPLTRDARARRRRDLLGGEDPRLGGELDERLVLREDGGEEVVGGGQRCVPAERDLNQNGSTSRFNSRRREGEMDAADLGVGGEPSEPEPRGGGGGGAGIPEEEGGLGQVELGGDGLHPPRVGGPLGVVEDAHRRRVALERLRREGVHLRRPHRRQRHVMPRADREKGVQSRAVLTTAYWMPLLAILATTSTADRGSVLAPAAAAAPALLCVGFYTCDCECVLLTAECSNQQ